MPAGPRTTPYPVVVQFNDPTTALTPTKLLESSSLYVNSLSAVTVSAGTYLNLPSTNQITSVFQLNGTGTFETTGYARNTYATTASLNAYETTAYARNTYATTAQLESYVLTSINYNLSSNVSNHLTSAVHWDLSTLNSYYINASGDSASAEFYLSSVSATFLSATSATLVNLTILSAIEFSDSPVLGVRQVGWNTDDQTLEIKTSPTTTLQVGQEQVILVENKSGASIANGKVVYVSGTTGGSGKLNIALASASSVDAEAAFILGVATQDIPNNQSGFITTFGKVNDINIPNSQFTEGDIVYLSNIPGEFTRNRPAKPSQAWFQLGRVINTSNGGGTNGILFVTIRGSFDVSELHDVASSIPGNRQVLVWNSASGFYEPNNVSAISGIENYATTASLNAYETTAYARSTYATTGQLTSYALTASLDAYETTGYARNTYATTAALGAYETTSYARNTYATTGQLTSYALTASLALYETTGYARNTYATTAAYATTASLGAYETTSYARNNYSLTSHNHSFSALSGLSDVMVTATPTFAQSLVWNGSKWSPSSVGGAAGAGTPGGSNTQIQYNNGGSFGGTAALIWNNSTLLLSGTNIAALNLSAGTISATTYQNLPNFATTANSVTSFQGTSVFETTGYARNTYATTASLALYETTGYARNTYATTASLAAYETTGYARNTYATTAALAGYETTGYARNTYATTASLASYALTASLASYETTAYARNNYLVTSVNVTALNGTGVFETTGYARNTYATTASLASYALTASLGAYETTAYSRNTFETTGYARNTYATTASLAGYETTAYSRNNYVLTSTNLGLSSTVTGHIASAVHWDLATLNSYYINASGDSVTGAFTFGSVTATNVSATNYFNLPSGTAIWNANSLNGTSIDYSIPPAEGSFLAYTDYGLLGTKAWRPYDSGVFAGLNVFNANKIQNQNVTATVPTAGQVLAYDGINSRWTPSSAPFGGGPGGGNPDGPDFSIQFRNGTVFSGVSQGQWLPNFNTFQFATLYADYYNGAFGSLNKDSGLISTAVSATNYYNLPSGIAIWNASSIRDYAVVTGTPTNGDMLYFSSTQWKRRQFTYGTAAPTGGSDGDIYLQYT